MSVVTSEAQTVSDMFDTKRVTRLGAGILALTASTYLTVATAPVASMTSSAVNASRSTAAVHPNGWSTTEEVTVTSLATSRIPGTPDQRSQETGQAALPSGPTSTSNSSSTAHSAGTPAHAHLFGPFISTLARLVPGGKGHGELISFFAKILNPGHTVNRRTTTSNPPRQ